MSVCMFNGRSCHLLGLTPDYRPDPGLGTQAEGLIIVTAVNWAGKHRVKHHVQRIVKTTAQVFPWSTTALRILY
jgi:hypothetical protein